MSFALMALHVCVHLSCRVQEHAEEALATLQREHTRSQQKMGALLESRVKNVGDLRQQLEHQIDSLKSQLETSQVTHTHTHSTRCLSVAWF